ncbi:D-alanine--D-alanine ligase [Sediminibacillus albus]|uniref:D-alanine--D-alanine ligase n=1 Tax=Sediminibacillus albus TaxID=407036 RepID=A0A1G8VLN3_9BACI|nr:D-alanine--D-alanine ligase [Sediminibacillus albus]SDJ66986.1 D-alanine-D-alanine ligase [Sediminibacillus albus]
MKIAVLYGGTSGEREVSLSTGKGIIEALKKNGHEVIGIDFDPRNLTEIVNLKVDLAFIGLHGKYGEDGKIQGLLEMLNIPYVGSGVLASALAMDKSKAKQIFEKNGLPVAKGLTIEVGDYSQEEIVEMVKKSFTPPYVVKPNQEGSTLGLTIVKKEEQLPDAIKLAAESDDVLLIEDFISGKEYTVAIVGQRGKEIALPVIEIIPKSEYYDFDSKYKPGGSEHIIPARIGESLTKEVKNLAVEAHQLLGCDVYSRVDFIITEDNHPIILEVNTLPGMTPTSLFPDAAKVMGWTYEQMIEEFVSLSIKRN